MAGKKAKKRELRYADAQKRAREADSSFVPTSFTIPKGMELFKFDEADKYLIDVLPYVASENNEVYDEGELAHEHTYYIHPRIGPEQKYFPCNRMNKKGDRKCAGCEALARLRMQPDVDEDEENALRPKRRQLWIFKDRKDKKAEPKLFEAAYYGKGQGFGETVDAILDAMDEDDPRRNFFHLSGGSSLQIKTKKDTFKKRSFFRPSRIEIVPRKLTDDYEEEILDDLPCLDELILEADYDEFKAALAGATDDEDEKPKKKKKGGDKPKKRHKDEDEEDEDERALEDEDDEDDETEEENEDEEEEEDEGATTAEDKDIEVGTRVRHKKWGDCTVTHISKDGTALRMEDDEDEEHRGVAPAACEVIEDDEDEDEDEDEEEEKPKKSKKSKKSKKDDDDDDDTEDDDDDDDEDDDEDEEEEKPKKSKKSKKSKKDDDDDDDDIPFDDDDTEDDDNDDDEEEKEKPKKKRRK